MLINEKAFNSSVKHGPTLIRFHDDSLWGYILKLYNRGKDKQIGGNKE